MKPSAVVALVLAFASTVMISVAYLREQGAVKDLPALSLRRPLRSARLLIHSREWLTGFALESGGFILYVIALALAPLALVQSIGAGGVGALAVATSWLGHRKLTRREAAGAGVAVVGLIFLAISLSGGSAPDGHGSTVQILLWLGATVAAAAFVFTSGRAFFGPGVADGIAGGLLFSVGDISTKLATQGGVRFVFIVGLVGGYVLGSSLLQIGYQSGAALTVAGIATLLTNALPIAAGTVVLHEPLPTGVLGVLRVMAYVTVTFGAILLARPEKPAPRRTSDAAAGSVTAGEEAKPTQAPA